MSNFEPQIQTLQMAYEEIIAKKLRYRLREVRSRDIFDIAVALQKDRNVLKDITGSNGFCGSEI